MSVFSSIPFSNQTVYRNEFHPKNLPRIVLGKEKRGDKIFQPTDPFPSDEPERGNQIEAFRRKICEQYPSMADHFSDPVDSSFGENVEEPDRKTCYRRDYDSVLGFELKELPKRISLPEEWHTPITTQQISFRPPYVWGELPTSRPFRPSNNLTPISKVREALRTTTGESNYMTTHGKVAAGILEK